MKKQLEEEHLPNQLILGVAVSLWGGVRQRESMFFMAGSRESRNVLGSACCLATKAGNIVPPAIWS